MRAVIIAALLLAGCGSSDGKSKGGDGAGFTDDGMPIMVFDKSRFDESALK